MNNNNNNNRSFSLRTCPCIARIVPRHIFNIDCSSNQMRVKKKKKEKTLPVTSLPLERRTV